MAGETTTNPLIRTKLLRPPIVGDHVHRSQLLKRLDQRRQRPLTLVTAPAGYGKSTLVSCWLESCDLPAAWLSLDETDNDLHLFLSYFLAAVQTVSPAAGKEIQTILNSTQLPPLSILGGILINELDQIEQAFILTLDDYHAIHTKAIHDLLIEILKHPPHAMHLVLASRVDPPLPLASLRARGEMTEIRGQDLRFSFEETAEYLQKMLGKTVEDGIVALLGKKTEGWITGLRLVALSIRQCEDLERIISNLPDNNRYVMEYLVEEVLSQQPPATQEYLLATSILDRFCAPLCDAVCASSTSSDLCEIRGEEFIDWIEKGNLFVVSLDEEHRWVRLHHLFQELLQRMLKRRFSSDTIDALHRQASAWLADNGLIEEALQHALKGGDTKGALRLVAQHRHDLMNREQWHQFERLLRMFPAEQVNRHPVLLLSRAWLNYYLWYSLDALKNDLEVAENLASEVSIENCNDSQVMNEVAALQGGLLYGAADGVAALDKSQQVLESTPQEHECVRSTALYHMGGAYQLIGDSGEAERVLWEGLKDAAYHHPSSHARMMTSLCFVYWCEADLRRTHDIAKQFLKMALKNNLQASTAYARYFIGVVHYDRNELDAAEKQLKPIVNKPYLYPVHNWAGSAFPLGLTYLAQGNLDEARRISKTISNFAFEQRNTLIKQSADAFQAELDLRQGRTAEAEKWARQFKPGELRLMHRFFVPQMTWIKVLLACGTSDTHREADAFLQRSYDFQASAHNTNALIDILVLQSLLHDSLGDETAAFEKLTESLVLAEPGRFIRPFLDLGLPMFDMLNRLAKLKIDIGYIGKLLTAFRNEKNAGIPPNAPKSDPGHEDLRAPIDIMETLTKRELEITALLVKRQSNKEIAETLFISPETVKRHVYNVFQKLNVSTRLEAAEKATALGLI